MDKCHVAVAVIAIALITLVRAQAPSFEVASVKPNTSGDFQSGPWIQGGRVTFTNRTLKYLVQFAYSSLEASVHDKQIVGGPGWIDTDGFDINATIGSGGVPSPELPRLMLQTLLADRFHLKLRKESRELPVYALVVARPDGRLGSGLRPRPDLKCEAVARPPMRGFPDPDLKKPAVLCGLLKGGKGTLSFRGVPVSSLLRPSVLGGLDRIVIDETRLSGNYDIDLTWAVQSDTGAPPAAPAEAPSIFTAVQEQLGLKLEPARAPVDVLVIEDAQRPSPD